MAPIGSPSSGFADRVLAASERAETPVVWRFPRWPAGVAAAAAVVAAVALGMNAGRVGKKATEQPTTTARVRAIDPKDLTDALADAGTATWDLAREASAPAARVGRQMLGSAALPGAAPSVSLPEGVGPPAEVWKRVENRVSAGARPIGGTARHAFGFLLAVAPRDDGGVTEPFVRVEEPHPNADRTTPCRASFRPLDRDDLAVARRRPGRPAVEARAGRRRGHDRRRGPARARAGVRRLAGRRRPPQSPRGARLALARPGQAALKKAAAALGENLSTVRDDLFGDAVVLALRLPPEGRPEERGACCSSACPIRRFSTG